MSTVSEKKLSGEQNNVDKGLFMHKNLIEQDVTIPADMNAISGGPISVSSGKAVTVESGAVWTIV